MWKEISNYVVSILCNAVWCNFIRRRIQWKWNRLVISSTEMPNTLIHSSFVKLYSKITEVLTLFDTMMLKLFYFVVKVSSIKMNLKYQVFNPKDESVKSKVNSLDDVLTFRFRIVITKWVCHWLYNQLYVLKNLIFDK